MGNVIKSAKAEKHNKAVHVLVHIRSSIWLENGVCVRTQGGQYDSWESYQEGFTEKVTFDQRLEESEGVSQVANRRNVKYKGPEVGSDLGSFEQQDHVAGHLY